MGLDGFVALFGSGAFTPVFQGYPNGSAVGIARKTQQTESGDGGAALDPRGGKGDVLDLFADGHRTVQGSGKRKLNVDVQIALVLFRKEARGKLFPKKASPECDNDK